MASKLVQMLFREQEAKKNTLYLILAKKEAFYLNRKKKTKKNIYRKSHKNGRKTQNDVNI